LVSSCSGTSIASPAHSSVVSRARTIHGHTTKLGLSRSKAQQAFALSNSTHVIKQADITWGMFVDTSIAGKQTGEAEGFQPLSESGILFQDAANAAR
jgi:hypothetical protein